MQSQHHRFAIWSSVQHPYKHSGAELVFTNSAFPGVVNVEQALNWIAAVLYPQTQAAVADLAALNALVGNTINDYRVVLDDGDGKAASYRWEQREGDVAAKWYKIYDMDWGADSILEQYLTRTQGLYAFKGGTDDLDDTGAAITGTLAGQRIYGGKSANTNLTLSANSGDGTGAQTGYVQFTDNARPTSDNALDLGTASLQFKRLYAGTSVIVAADMTVSSGSITSASGAISFSNENLSTSGTFASGTITVSGDMVISTGSITSASGAISFSNENLTTTGTLASGTLTISSSLVLAAGSITSGTGAISFDNENLTTTGTYTGAQFITGAISITGAGTVITSTGADLNFTATGGFGIVFNAAMYGTTGEFTGSQKAGTIFEANASIYMSGVTNTIATYAADITLSPSTNILKANATFQPTSDNTRDLGTTLLRWNDLFMGGSIGDGTNTIAIATLLSLRNILSGASSGMSLFYDGSTWAASAPDTEIAHSSISGLTTSDAGHTQFAMLAGRSGGQTLQGGTAGGEHLLLESTANASKGLIKFKDSLVPNTNASYSGGWSGTDLGGTSNYINDIYMKGEMKGLRAENLASGSIASSGQCVGRIYYDTTLGRLKVDTGAAINSVFDTGMVVGVGNGGTGLTSYTTGDIIYASAANTLAKLAAGTDGQFLSQSSGIPSWAWGPVLLVSTDAAGATTTAFTGLSSTYSTYIIEVSDYIPGTDGTTLYMQVSTDNGSSYLSANYRYSRSSNSEGTAADSGSASDAQLVINGVGNDTGENSSWTFKIRSPSNSNTYKNIMWDGTVITTAGVVARSWGAGAYTGATTAINAVKFYASSGTHSGLFRLYGVR